jgi:hypothetical protein
LADKEHKAFGATPGDDAMRKGFPHGGDDFGPVIVNVDGDKTAESACQRYVCAWDARPSVQLGFARLHFAPIGPGLDCRAPAAILDNAR